MSRSTSFPTINTGGWLDVLNDASGAFEVTLDRGTFLWLWDFVNSKHSLAENELATSTGHRQEFKEAYHAAMCRAKAAFDAAGDWDEEAVETIERRTAQRERDEQRFGSRPAKPVKVVKKTVKKAAPKKKIIKKL